MAHRFLLQIVDADSGTVLRFPGGSPVERDLIHASVQAIVARMAGDLVRRDFVAAVTDAIVAKGVGIGRSERAVTRAIRDGVTDTLETLQRDTAPLGATATAIRAGLIDVLRALKHDARPLA